ncbi:hypothetical protein [Pseudomonas moorei]|uniref:hypothetical protein n=1 Tax=Pseudomonas moorei TaxID=395599 RepID=UPI001FF43156|nr:hypothetical protein [Pseudomonas moorei]
MNALRSTFNCAAMSALISAVSIDAQANVPDIALAPSHVEGYIQCIQTAYVSNSWHSGTVAECRASNPAVQSLHQGDYVALTFTTEQSRSYDQSWKRWVEFDKSLKSLVYSKGLAEMFNAAGVQTAHSFQKVSTDLDARFSELNSPPFSWYPGQKLPYKTANGMSLEQLHTAELDRFSHCLGAAINTLDVKTATQQTVDIKAGVCTRDIMKLNTDASEGLYGAGDFSQVINRYWTKIASSQANAKETERIRIEQEKANSWPVKLKAMVGPAMVFVWVFVGLFAAYRYVKNFSGTMREEVVNGRVRRQHRRRGEVEDVEYAQRSTTRQPATSFQRSDLGTFTLRHKKVCSPTTKHACASCCWWAGERTSHPVTQELYVKVGTVGKCTHRHPGSPHGMKRYDAGTICKDFQDLGV